MFCQSYMCAGVTAYFMWFPSQIRAGSGKIFRKAVRPGIYGAFIRVCHFGVPGFRNGLQNTYSLGIFGKAFETRAADTDVEYSFGYFYPVKSSSVYYSDLYVNIEPVCSGNLETVCMVLSQAYADTFEKAQVMPSGVHPCAFGCALRCCSILLTGNRLERAALGGSFLMGWQIFL